MAFIQSPSQLASRAISAAIAGQTDSDDVALAGVSETGMSGFDTINLGIRYARSGNLVTLRFPAVSSTVTPNGSSVLTGIPDALLPEFQQTGVCAGLVDGSGVVFSTAVTVKTDGTLEVRTDSAATGACTIFGIAAGVDTGVITYMLA